MVVIVTQLCNEPMRNGLCALNAKHLGRHSTVTFYCDGCGKYRRGSPHQANEDVALCFLCSGAPMLWRAWQRGVYD